MEGRLPAAGAAAAGTGAPRPSAADGGEAAADADPAHHRAPHPWAHGASGNWSAVHAHDPFFDPYGGAAAAWAADAAAGDEDGEDGAFFDAGEDEEDAAFYGDDDEDWEDDAFYDEALDEVDPWAGVPDDDGGVDGDFRGRPPWDEL